MYTLTFDTSSKIDSCSIFHGERELITLTMEAKDIQSEKIISLIDSALSMVGVSKSDLKDIVVSVGPGSFTGIRIGIATALGLSSSLSIPLYGIDSFDIAKKVVPERSLFYRRGRRALIKIEEEVKEITSIEDDWINIDELPLTKSQIMGKIASEGSLKRERLLAIYGG